MTRTLSTRAKDSQIKPTDLVRFHQALAQWYKIHGRHDLPWRNTIDPYHIWLSEVMLQQTQVQTVLTRFYAPFLKIFPTVEALAAAPRDAVLKAWEGLGYYRRAAHLHEAAKRLAIEGGLAPYPLLTPAASGSPSAAHDLIDRLLALPGIGRNTAHAILAFAYHQPVAILEANVKRVVARIFALSQPGDAMLWAGAEALLNRATPFDYNQAMMDLGSLICTPKNPKCSACPARALCAGKTNPTAYPAPRAKKKVPTREVTIHVRENAAGQIFLERRDQALLGGLYGFPQVSGVAQTTQGAIGTVTHLYSHFKLIGHVIYARTRGKTNAADWYGRTQIAALPLSTLDHKVLALLDNCHTRAPKKLKAPAQPRKH
ncbi:MAG: A/G-specific adenine glycosylase [Alphaproteobacteria bacterium]|nr:A/G-specific adenine glycosylase [Alphaproteobacteria bacterium]